MQVPVGRLLACQSPALSHAHACYDDGRFTVWTATCTPRDKELEPRLEQGGRDELRESKRQCGQEVCSEREPRPPPARGISTVVGSLPSSDQICGEAAAAARAGRAPAGPTVQSHSVVHDAAVPLQAASGAKRAARPVEASSRKRDATSTIDWSLSKAQRKRARRKATGQQ